MATEAPALPSTPPTAADQRSPAGARLVAAAVFFPALAVLVIAATLDPSPVGRGTHTQLGLAPCGFLAATGLPCATCGMTTAFSHAADGNLVASFLTQPAGAVLAVLTAAAAIVSGYALATGANVRPVLKAFWRPRFFIILAAIAILGWGYTLALACFSAKS